MSIFNALCQICGNRMLVCTCSNRRVEISKIADYTPAPAAKPVCTPAVMTGDQFVIWLRGYIASVGVENATKGDWKVVAAKLDTLGGPK